MKQRKTKIFIFIVLSAVGLTAGFFFSGFVNLATSGARPELANLRPALIFASLAENQRHRMLTLCVELVVVAGIAALVLMSRRETFESDTRKVAGAIETPVATGQGQHGTARWLRKDEWKKTFAYYALDPEDEPFSALLSAGKTDIEKVREYAKTQTSED